MAIRIDTALQMIPDRQRRQMDDEMKFGGYPNGRGPISEVVMPLNRELIERADTIRHLKDSVRRLTEANDSLRKVAQQALEALKLSRVVLIPSGVDCTPKIQKDAIEALRKELGHG